MVVQASSQFPLLRESRLPGTPEVCIIVHICEGVSRDHRRRKHMDIAMGWYFRLERKPLFRQTVTTVPHLQLVGSPAIPVPPSALGSV